MKEPVLPLLPNRVRRNYVGGALLSDWERQQQQENPSLAVDDNRPEDWLASTTPAINAGMDPDKQEGIGRVSPSALADSEAKEICFLDTLFAAHGEYYLGASHLRHCGPQLGFLAKLLDSSMRLHTQAHPTREFARERLGSNWGKLECYVILAKREGYPADLRLGFQHPPSREQWREIIATQDISAMDACFESIRVEVGQVWLVPGGLTHALGAGLLLLEVMEPSDLVVRCEFEREGIVVPEQARFMGRDLEFCLDVFDYSASSVADIKQRCLMKPHILRQGHWGNQTRWVSLEQTNCFEVIALSLVAPFDWEAQPQCRLLVVSQGRGSLHVQGRSYSLYPGARFLIAAAASQIRIEPQMPESINGIDIQPLECWYCCPGAS